MGPYVSQNLKDWRAARFDWLPFSSIIQEALQFELIMAKRLTHLCYLGPRELPILQLGDGQNPSRNVRNITPEKKYLTTFALGPWGQN